jgi:hypothetical protein
MKRRIRLSTLLLMFAAPFAAAVLADVKVTDHQYVRHDGGSDAVIASCGSDATTEAPGGDAGGNRQQNEPAVAVMPDDPSFIVASANDYCTVPLTADAWQGIYVSRDGGSTWINSLLPGYPGDTSTAGASSPLSTNSGDPLLDFDNDGHLFAAGITFNRTVATGNGPKLASNGHMYVARYTRNPAAPLGMTFDDVVIVGEGTPAQFPFGGRFNDKPSMRVDDWADSPHEGNVYVAWTLFPGFAGADQILFSRSTDAGVTFSNPIKVSKGVASAQDSTIAVRPNGDVYVFWRQFAANAHGVTDAIVFVRSTDGGAHFSDPATVTPLVPYESRDEYVSGGSARDCGDGPDLCVSSFVFARNGTAPAAVADAAGTLYVSFEELVAAADNDDTYHPDGRARAVIARSSNGGATWSKVVIDPQTVGHQFWPTVTYDKVNNRLAVIYYDSRSAPAYSPNRPIGNASGGISSCGPAPSPVCNVLNTFIAVSADGGSTWSPTEVSTVGNQPQYETFDDRDVPFFGDYISIDAGAGRLFGVWTDNRDIVPGTDPREAVQDGFDVHQCRVQNAAGTFSADNCPNAGGLNANIYGVAQ